MLSRVVKVRLLSYYQKIGMHNSQVPRRQATGDSG
jgi:hypothetical protein